MIILGEIRKDKSTAKDDAIRISELVIDVKKTLFIYNSDYLLINLFYVIKT